MKIYEIKTREGIIYKLVGKFDKPTASGILEYFIKGKGWVKTKSFRVLPDAELPDRWDNVSWLEICKIHEKYGIEVSDEFAECKTAGIISRQTIYGKYSIYQKIKNIIPENFDSFFEILSCDYLMSCFGMYFFDIIALDNALSKADKEYNNVEGTYKGEKISMNEYVKLKYGAEYVKIIDVLIDIDSTIDSVCKFEPTTKDVANLEVYQEHKKKK